MLNALKLLRRRFLQEMHEWYFLGRKNSMQYTWNSDAVSVPVSVDEGNPIEEFFEKRLVGPGIWKWRHYFEIYHRHLKPLRSRSDLVILEIGVYSGGSLDMWRSYFSSSARVIGVDIEPDCVSYKCDGVDILIGDQSDSSFWHRVLSDGTLPVPDVVIDDGGHTPEQQRITLEALLPVMRAGGVYICEDIHGLGNAFASYVYGLADNMNGWQNVASDPSNHERRTVVKTNDIQANINSVHLYPYVVVVEKRESLMSELVAPKKGSKWEPFLP